MAKTLCTNEKCLIMSKFYFFHYTVLTASNILTFCYASAAKDFWKHCGKIRNFATIFQFNSIIIISIIYIFHMFAQTAATQAVNPGVLSSNPISAIILSDKSHCDKRYSPFTKRANSLCGKAANCLESMLCGVLVWESYETHE